MTIKDFYIGCLRNNPNDLQAYLKACQTNENDIDAMSIWLLKDMYL